MSSTDRRADRRLRRVAAALLVLVGGGAVTLLLWPSGAQVREIHIGVWYRLWRLLGSPGWFTPEVSEQLANVLVLVVPMAAATVLAPRPRWWWLLPVGASIGVAVELAQRFMLLTRVPDPVDAIANAVGAAAGIALGMRLRRRWQEPEPAPEPAPEPEPDLGADRGAS